MVDNDIRIGICGKANSGKNLTADLFIGMFRHSSAFAVDVVAFADPIKKMAELMFPWANPDGWYGSSNLRETIIPNALDKDKQPLTYRQVLKDIGSLGRAYDPDHWVKVFANEALINTTGRHMLITNDVRFRNEFDYLRSNNFFIIKLLRNTTTSTHPTETSQDKININEFDAVIDNNGTIEGLQRQLDEIKPKILASRQ